MPYRRLVLLTLPFAVIGALAACSADIPLTKNVPAPFSQRPVPSASAGQTEYVCTSAYHTVTSGAAGAMNDLVKSDTAAQVKALQGTFTSMAGELTTEATQAKDPKLAQALRTMASQLTTGTAQTDPQAYVQGDFQNIGKGLDGVC